MQKNNHEIWHIPLPISGRNSGRGLGQRFIKTIYRRGLSGLHKQGFLAQEALQSRRAYARATAVSEVKG